MENDNNLNSNNTSKDIRNPEPMSGSAGFSESLKQNESFLGKLQANRKLIKTVRTVLFLIASIVIAFLSVVFVLYAVPALSEMTSGHRTQIKDDKDLMKSAEYKKQVSLITKDIQRLSRKYNAYTSGQSYIIINTTDNRFFLYRNKKLVREGFCSSGSYTMLQTEGDKKWIFKTPKGKYWIHGKTTNPVWKKPDWAFVEEGLPIPPKDDFSRYEYGVLGDYALAIGDGYLIHGTIYKRFLGMPVTHGCVRLNDEDLEVIYNTLNIGSKVYIF
jgi:lipoprotein-anchoring transpeptidase ErfK/SrfK